MTYTSDNRLATYNRQSVEYDADGNMIRGPLDNRTGVIENGKLISYVVNPNAILSQVLIKTDEKGKQTFYVYGLGLIGQEDAGVYHTYHHDRRGSTVALTDISGNVTDRIQYSPYGSLTHRTGNTPTPFQYNGEYGVMTDANGLYHMRARYYSPEIRRFINQDILPGSINNGQSLNRYAYVNGNPVSYVDPFGLSPDGENKDLYNNISQQLKNQLFHGVWKTNEDLTEYENLVVFSPVWTYYRIINADLPKETKQEYFDAYSEEFMTSVALMGSGGKGAGKAGGIITKNGIKIEGFTGHGVDRAIGDGFKRAGVSPQGILDAMIPL